MTPRWTVLDFVLVVLGGLGGSLAAGAAAVAFEADINVTVLSSYGGQFVGQIAVLVLIARGRGLNADSLGFDIRPADTLYLGVGVVIQIAIALLFIPLQQILVPDGGFSQEVTEMFTQIDTPSARVAMVAISTFLAPLSEELMFRGVLLRSLANRSRRSILVITAAIFGLFHVAGTSSAGAALLVFFQIFLVGLVLAHLALRHDRIGPSIFVHAGFNLLTTLILLLPPELLEQLEQAGG